MPDTKLIATVLAGGKKDTTWNTLMVRRDYGNYVPVFQLSAAEPGPFGQGWAALRLTPGTPVQVQLGGVQVING